MAAQLLEDLETVTISELEIEDDSVVLVHQRQSACLLAGGRRIDGVRFIAQDPRDQLQNRFVVVDYEDAHSFGAGVHRRV